MRSRILPEKTRGWFTWRRLRNTVQAPRKIVRNLRFWWNDEVSDSQHIFVMGPPRSGTTLLKNVLQSHSNICGVKRETWFFMRWDIAGFSHPEVPDKIMKRMVGQSKNTIELFDQFANFIKEKKEGKRFLEKTPEHALKLEYILNHFPKSDIAFIVRDPRDGLRSAKGYPGYWSSLPDKDRPGGYLETWRRCFRTYRQNRENVLFIKYEDFCRNPYLELSRLAERIGIEVERQQLEPTTYAKESGHKKEKDTKLGKKITDNSVGEWKNELGEGEVRRVERYLGEEMSELGYTPSFIS